MHTSTQRLTDSLFSGETACYFERLATTLLNLLFREDALQETFAVMSKNAAHTLDLDDVDADGNVDTLRWKERRGKIGHACYAEKVSSKRSAWLTHEGRKEQWPIFAHYLIFLF